LYLGRAAQNPEKEERIDEILVKPDYTYCTYAYMLSPKGIKNILKYEVEKAIIPADEFLTATYIAHPRMDIRLKYPPALRAYALAPCIVGQRNKNESGSDTESSEFI
jgi:GR25 family glycosyltransferase involved in LPS biosynthesis